MSVRKQLLSLWRIPIKLDGVSIVEDTVRHYIDSKYFAHILSYTGKISSDELTDLNEQVVAEGGSEDAYTINDVVGKKRH